MLQLFAQDLAVAQGMGCNWGNCCKPGPCLDSRPASDGELEADESDEEITGQSNAAHIGQGAWVETPAVPTRGPDPDTGKFPFHSSCFCLLADALTQGEPVSRSISARKLHSTSDPKLLRNI